jgi:hypothetical protein
MYSKFLGQHRILPYLFVNTLFNGHSVGSGFTKFGSENDKIFVQMLKKNISGIKKIVYQPKKLVFGHYSLSFVSFNTE